MDLVDYDVGVLVQHRGILGQIFEQDANGDKNDMSLHVQADIHWDMVADHLSNHLAHLSCNSFGYADTGNSSWLCTEDLVALSFVTSLLVDVLRHLGTLTTSGLTWDYRHLI